MADNPYDWKLWTERLTQKEQCSTALAHLVRNEVHGNLQRNLPEAHIIAEHALKLFQESDSIPSQLNAARLVFRYASNLEDWLTAALWFSAKAQDMQLSQADRLSHLQKLQQLPSYLPYWDKAKEWLVEILYDIDAANPNTVLTMLIKSFFEENDIDFSSRPKRPIATSESSVPVPQEPDHEVVCDWCKSPVKFSKRLVGGNGNLSFCSPSCAKSYSDKHMMGYDVLNPRNW